MGMGYQAGGYGYGWGASPASLSEDEALLAIVESGKNSLGRAGMHGSDVKTWSNLGESLQELAFARPAACKELGEAWIASAPAFEVGESEWRWGSEPAREAGAVAIAIAQWAQSASDRKAWRPDWRVDHYRVMESDDEGGEREEWSLNPFHAEAELAPGDVVAWRGFVAIAETAREGSYGGSASEVMGEQVQEWGMWAGSSSEEKFARLVEVALALHERKTLAKIASSAPAPRKTPRM